MTNEVFEDKINIAERTFIDKGLLHFAEEVDNSKRLPAFLLDLVLIYCSLYDTLNSDNNIDTVRGKHRSVEDLFRITKYYYPEVTLLEVMTELTAHARANSLFALPCSNIKKFTFFPPKSRGYGQFYAQRGLRDDIDVSLDIAWYQMQDYFNKNI